MQPILAVVPNFSASTRAIPASYAEAERQSRLEEGQRPNDNLDLAQLVAMATAFGIEVEDIAILNKII